MSAPPEESNPLSRQRVSRACDLCRRKKVKCDGATPVCTNCKGIGLECSFKDMTKKRGPPKGYIEAIENRLYKLENFLADLAKGGDIQSKQLLSELNSPLETPTGEQIRARPQRRAPKSERNKVFFWQQDKAGKRKRETLKEHHPSTLSDEEGGKEEEERKNESKKPDQTSREESVDEGVGQLAMDENGQVRYLGKSSGYYLLQNSRTYQNGAFHFDKYGNRPRHRKYDKDVNPLELPPKDLSEHLIKLYFKHFYPFLPLFYKRQLFSTLDHPTIDPIAPLLLNAIYAVASRISPDVRVRSDINSPDTAGDIFFDRAEKLLDESYDTPRISTVQALLLLASHQHGAMKSARAWLYSGMAFRMAQDLGLNRNCEHWNIPKEEGERRKRVFWCCYVVDRLASAMYGRATTFEERDCDVPFPSVDDDDPYYDDGPNAGSSPPVRLLESFTNLIKICDILGHVLKNIYYVRSLQYTGARQADSVLSSWNKKLHQWYDQLPDCLQINNRRDSTLPSTAVCQLHMIYHTTVILLHRPFIPGPNQSLMLSLLPCASICSSAADSILSITSSMLSENKLRFIMNYSVYYIFTSAIIFTKSAWNNNSDTSSTADNNKFLEVKLKLTKCMQALNEIETIWSTASKSSQILAELSGFRDLDQCHNHPATNYMQPQHHLENCSTNSYLSPQSSHNSSPQLQSNDGHRMNSSNLRFPIRRIDPSSKQEDDETSKTLYTPNSTANMDFAVANPFQNNTQVNNTTTAMDPFAAPGIIPMPSPRHCDLLGTEFWSVPSSLDVNEWNSFMNTNSNNNDNPLPPLPHQQQQQQQQQQPTSFVHPNSSFQDRLYEAPNTNGGIYDHHYRDKKLIHTDQHVDVLSGVSLPMEQQTSTSTSSNVTLMSYLPQIHQQQQRSLFNHQANGTATTSTVNTSTVHNSNHNHHHNHSHSIPTSIPMNGRPSSSNHGARLSGGTTHNGSSGDLANAYYW